MLATPETLLEVVQQEKPTVDDFDGMQDDLLCSETVEMFILVYSDQRSCAIRPAIPKVSGHRSRSIRPSFLSIRPTAGTSRLECTMN